MTKGVSSQFSVYISITHSQQYSSEKTPGPSDIFQEHLLLKDVLQCTMHDEEGRKKFMEHLQSIICCTNTSSSSLSSMTFVAPSYSNKREYRMFSQMEWSTYFEVSFASQFKKSRVCANKRLLGFPRAAATDDGEVCKGI